MIKSSLIIINKISKHHYRSSDFFNKIENILLEFSDSIKQSLSNFEIFKIFKHNKRLLLFLIQKSIIEIDQSIFEIISHPKFSHGNYIQFFYHEIKHFLSERKIEENKELIDSYDLDKFEEKRKNGENDQFICQLIRNDLVDDFIVYINKTNYSITNPIKTSIFETNPFLIKNKNETSLIEYSAFYGSIKILKYLFFNNAILSPSLWFYAIHGKNPEIIHFLEENDVIPIDETYRECFYYSVKCFHDEIANYIQDNLIHYTAIICYDSIFKSHNYFFFPKDIQNSSQSFFYLCKYNYVFLVQMLMMVNNNIDEAIITNFYFIMKFYFNIL